MPMPDGGLDLANMDGMEKHYCRGPCGGPLQCDTGLVCNRCKFDNSIDRQVRHSTKDLAAQHQAYAKGEEVLNSVEGDSDAEDDDEMREEEEDPEFDPDSPVDGFGADSDSDTDSVDSVMGFEPVRKTPTKSTSKAKKSKVKKSKAKKASCDFPKLYIRKRQDARVDRQVQARVDNAVTFYPEYKQKNDDKVTMRCMGSDPKLIPYAQNKKGQKKVAFLVKKFPDMGDDDETDPATIRAHCCVLLSKYGYRYGDCDGPAHKYALVIERMMNLSGGFKIKTQFEKSNLGMAQKLALQLAKEDKTDGRNASTTLDKLAHNYLCAFNAYCKVLVMEKNGELNLDPTP